MAEINYQKILPIAVRGGSFENDGINLTTSLGEHSIKWEDVDFLLIARIEEITKITVQQDKPQAFPLGGRMAQAKQKEEVKKDFKQSELFAAYLFVKNQEKPFRFDTIATNFKEMLGSEGGYSGWANFNSVFRKIIESSPAIRLDPSASGFIQMGKKQIKTYRSKDDALRDAFKHYGQTPAYTSSDGPAPASINGEQGEEVYKVSFDD